VVLVLGAVMSAPAAAETTSQYATLIHSFNPKLADYQSQRLAREVITDAQRAHIDARLLIALVTVESRWRQSAVSRAGARGLGQLMPHTAQLLGVDPRDSRENLLGAATYLARMIRKFGDQGRRLHLAIAAYNAGPVAIERAGGIPHNGETPEYVRRVIALWHALQTRVGDTAHALPADTYAALGSVLPVAPFDDIVSVEDLAHDTQTVDWQAASASAVP
jgi:soluble lytic murein transglycosylase-like protein